MTTRTDKPRGQLVARTGFVFGSLTSVATNVLHTYLPTVHMPEGLALVIAARLGAAIWPIGLLLSIEVLARVAWRRGPAWTAARFGGAGAVAFGSAVISYSHVREVLLAWGYGHPAAEFGPLTLDGLMVVCGFALLSLTPPTADSNRHNDAVHLLARPIPAATPKSTVSQEIPLAAQIEALSGPIHSATETAPLMSGQADTTTGSAASGEDSDAADRRERARALHSQGWTHARIAAELAVSKRTIRRYLATEADTPEDTSTATEDPTASAVSGADWLSGIETNHHDNHQGVLA
ncbi:helix-turn-helix domain-containing protein [Nocardia tengchongensis]|uniref:Helix-turn-helix domain-containing protein n=1 Tax=Nocardia tengchongensis TaxID=2055889 RepID=A0ABX8CZ58_9NOCA|nr:helix-turn-helix domain-containing protein [Nocardia tengchongensis]QVI24129.1 helix-turn-helix domain-containing protein [Nocardia tengchongensis]